MSEFDAAQALAPRHSELDTICGAGYDMESTLSGEINVPTLSFTETRNTKFAPIASDKVHVRVVALLAVVGTQLNGNDELAGPNATDVAVEDPSDWPLNVIV